MFDTLIEDFEEDATGAVDNGKFATDEAEVAVVQADVPLADDEGPTPEELAASELEAEPVDESWSDDPVRMYLTQMGEIPLLTRKEEISLAKEIEVTRGLEVNQRVVTDGFETLSANAKVSIIK